MNEKVKISAPWDGYVRELKELFSGDDEVNVTGPVKAGSDYRVKLYVANETKAGALRKLLPEIKDFGGVKLYVDVPEANTAESLQRLVEQAFAGNDNFAGASSVDTGITSNVFTYAEMEAAVVQYWNDNLGNPHGLETKTLEEVARDVFQGGMGEHVLWTTREVE